ncbi:3248_t:CDS:1, partial [Acaulospora morrowiae]
NQNITHIQMSTTIQNIDQLSTEIKTSIPIWQDIEKSIIDILRAGLFYNKNKNIGFMDYYKKQLDELRKSEDQEQYIINKTRSLLPNEKIYDTKIKAFSNSYYKSEPKIRQAILNYLKLIYKIAKEYFITDEKREEELQAWLNS